MNAEERAQLDAASLRIAALQAAAEAMRYSSIPLTQVLTDVLTRANEDLRSARFGVDAALKRLNTTLEIGWRAIDSMRPAGRLAEQATRLVALLTAHDEATGKHSGRVGRLSERVAQQMGLNDEDVQAAALTGLLHDIGKLGVAGAVLRSTGSLGEDGRAQIAAHPSLGEEILTTQGELATVAGYVRSHHERPDGRGYPDGLQGDEIPVISRIVGAADAYDTMISGRPYRPARSSADAVAELTAGANTQFDTSVVDALAAQVLKTRATS